MSENTEKLSILGRCGLKYTDELGTEYFVNGEMIEKSILRQEQQGGRSTNYGLIQNPQ